MQVEGLVFAGVASDDAVGLAGFFEAAFGVAAVEEEGFHRLTFPDGSTLALVPRDWVPAPSDTNLGFLVDDLVAATAELGALGVEPDGPVLTGGGFRYRHFTASDGRRFELLDRRD
jgi:hypothetical protein